MHENFRPAGKKTGKNVKKNGLSHGRSPENTPQPRHGIFCPSVISVVRPAGRGEG